MNSINQVTSGLASSLFLAVGLTRVAERLDPMLKQGGSSVSAMQSGRTCTFPCQFSRTCTFPCQFTPETGQ